MNEKNKSGIASKLLGTFAIPLVIFLALFLMCNIGGKPLIANETGFNNFVVYTAIIMITTMALSINLNSGRFDFSLGSMATLSSVISAKITYAIFGAEGNAVVMFVFCLILGGILGLLSGIVYVKLKIPPIIASLGVTLIFEGITYTITEGRYVMTEVQNSSMSAFTGTWMYAALIILVVLAAVYLIFDRTKFGYNYRALRDGQKVASDIGIKEVPNALGCYVICGALMGIVGFMLATRNSNINGGSLNFGSISIMFTAFLPMFIGGYIGRFSNEKFGYFLAAICMSLLNSTFAAFANEINASMQSIINAVLLVVFLIYLSNEYRIHQVIRNLKSKE